MEGRFLALNKADASGIRRWSEIYREDLSTCISQCGQGSRYCFSWKATLCQGHITSCKMLGTRAYFVVSRHFATSQVNRFFTGFCHPEEPYHLTCDSILNRSVVLCVCISAN